MGMLLLPQALCRLLNKTTFTVRRGAVDIHTGPIAIGKARQQLFAREEIIQFYVKEYGRDKSVTYSLEMQVNGRSPDITLIPAMSDKKGLHGSQACS